MPDHHPPHRRRATRDRHPRLLGPDITPYEDDARRRAIRDRRTNDVPAWDDKAHRPLGRVAALRPKRVATVSEIAELAAERDRREVSQQTKLARFLRAIDKEQTLCDQLQAAGNERAARIRDLRSTLEVGVSSDGDVLTDQGRTDVEPELRSLASQQDRARAEGRARRIAGQPGPGASKAAAVSSTQTDGPALC